MDLDFDPDPDPDLDLDLNLNLDCDPVLVLVRVLALLPNNLSPSACVPSPPLTDGRADLTVSSPNHKTRKNGGTPWSRDQGLCRDLASSTIG